MNCADCKYGLFEGAVNPRGAAVGQCRYNPPQVVVLDVPGDPEPLPTPDQQIPIGAFPTVLDGMWCRMFEKRAGAPNVYERLPR